MNLKIVGDQDNIIIDNIINKLNIYMVKNNQSLFNLATTLGFAYQPFHRLIKNRNIPNINTLITMARHLGYTVEELISDKIILDIEAYNSLADIVNIKKMLKIKIYIPSAQYIPLLNKKFIALKSSENTGITGINKYKIYTLEDHIHLDGEYIVKYKNQLESFNIISASSKFIIIEQNKKEVRIQLEHVQSIAKLLALSMVYDDRDYYIEGHKI